jgi:regulator of replication initiation timing
MGATDTIKEFARIATTAGLTKDVIDFLDKKASLLAEQVAALEQENTTLLRENRNLKLENEILKGQIQNTRPKGNRLDEVSEKILKAFFSSGRELSEEEIARHFQLSISMVGYHTDILWGKKCITSNRVIMGNSSPTYEITSAGRKYCVENGLAS